MGENEIKGPDSYYSYLRLAWPPFAIMATMAGVAVFGGSPGGPNIVGFDKVVHFFIFGLIATLLFRRLRIQFSEHRRWMIAFAGVVAFGVLDESLQFVNPNRTFDVYDWVADLSGAALALYVYRNWAWYRKLLELPLWGRRSKGVS